MSKILSIFLVLFLSYSNLSALDDVDLEFEAGVFQASFSGNISNPTNNVTFDDDLGFDDTTSSYFGIKAKFKNEWIPVLHINYLTFSENSNANLSNKTIGATPFNEIVNSNIDYTVFNTILYYEFKAKGKHKRMFGKSRYTGDYEIDLGFNIKNVDYNYDVVSTADSTKTEYIKVNSFIFLPYAGFQYYLYHFSFFANISTLSFSDVKSTSYNVGMNYEIMEDLRLGMTYIYEDFEETIINDTITFETFGLMFSIKYIF